MPHPKTALAAMLLCALAATSGCSRQETLAKTNADVAKAEADKAGNVADALKNRSDVAAKTSADAVSPDPGDRADAIEDRADAAYKVAIAKAEGDRKVTTQACESLPRDSRSACKKTADSISDGGSAQASATLDAAKAHSKAVQNQDNK